VSVGYLMVRSERRSYGLPLDRVVEVADMTEVLDVPRTEVSIRGLIPLRGRLVPLLHLAAFLGRRAPPAERGHAAVLVQMGEPGQVVAFEVDDADEVVREAPLPLPEGASLPWASGVASRGTGLVPILDLDSLGERIG
jgi:purine-binding chemotaxis protein CheW